MRLRGRVVWLVLLLPITARAEVADKCLPPWDGLSILSTVLAVALVCLLAWSRSWPRALAAFTLSVLWGWARFDVDDLRWHFAAALRAELAPSVLRAWEVSLGVQCALPLVACCLVSLLRRGALAR